MAAAIVLEMEEPAGTGFGAGCAPINPDSVKIIPLIVAPH